MSRELKDAVAQLAGTFNKDFVSITACSVQSVDLQNRQCTCLPLNGSSEASITVNLSAEPNDGILVTPSVGSAVLVAQTIQNDPFVLMFSDVDGFQIIQADFELNVSNSKISISNNAGDLATQLDALLTQLQALTVPTAWGPSGFPINSSDFATIKTTLDQLLNAAS
jgi:hypothetical protein